MAYFRLNLLISCFIICFTSSVNSSVCFWNSGCPYKYFAGKTPYNSVRGDIRDSVINVKGCEAVSIWGLYKHGKSYPNNHYAAKMEGAVIIRNYLQDSQAKGTCSLCAQDVENLKNWPIDKKVFKGLNELSDEGYQEMVGLGRRLRAVFPNLLGNLEQGEYSFRPTSVDKIEDSAKAFIEGIVNKGLELDKEKDYVMASHTTCEKYEKEVKSNSKTYEEVVKYQKSSEFLVTKDRIQRRAGLDVALTDDNVTALYDLCRYTWSEIDNKPSPWCAIFTSDDLQVLEYLEDLKTYYRSGYGTPMNKIFGNIPLTDLLKGFQEAKEAKGKKITAYFSRGTAVDMTITALGIFKDEKPLTGAKRNRDRKWRSSKLSNFGANIMAVLSKCEKEGATDYNVVFYLNEEPIKAICNEAICPWTEFEEKMKEYSDTKLDFCKTD
ncbi:multiple inositol polyphosphate phosphatase 1-like [Ostrinia nubilalis]|uniref:multiple inositol polyphosphate phosphatase 1-like n=1 Tax=Ostrinia nubilalis TaxID=29057 RepID=UPI0030822A40